MVQEALTNVARHANATEVIINLLCRDGEVVLDVSDNGVGLPEPAQARDSQFGLLGMRERAHILSGQLEVGNLPEGGARVRVRLPVRSPAPQHPGPAPVQ
jgi:signal transduction histidine kinase